MKKGILLLATFVMLAGGAKAADDFVEGELLISFQPGARGARAEGIRNGLSANRIKAWPQIQAEHWRLPPGLGVAQAIQALSANPNVLYAEPNYIVHTGGVPDDARRGELWAIHNIGQTGGAWDADIDALEAWQLSPGSAPVVVGVIDTGVDYNHVDLAGRIWVNHGEIAGNGIDDDGNGYVDDVTGWDFVNNDNDPMDDRGHGTHVSGTIAASGNNGIGVIGVAGLNLNVKIMPLKFIAASGYGTTADAVSCINYAASFEDPLGNKIVRLTSNSWGGGGKSKTLENAIHSCGALFVAAAGNDGSTTLHYPAAYSGANIISVAATDASDALASFSNFGSDWVDLGAPGVSVLSSTPGGSYASWSGTSMATPHVAGVAALLMSQNPALSVDEVKAQIIGTVDPVPSLAGKVLTGGRLNAAKVLGAPELPPDTTAPAAVADLAASPVSPHSVTLTWTAPSDNGGTAYLCDIRFSLNPITTEVEFASAAQVAGEPSPKAPGATETFTVEQLQGEKTYYFAVRTTDASGNASPISNPASATTPLADWFFVGGRLDGGQDMGNYTGVGVLPNGYWAVAYDDRGAGVLKCASLVPPGYGFTRETVMAGGFGPSLAYSPLEEISISHVDSSKKLWFVIKSGSTWTSTQLEGRDVYPHETSMAYAGADPVISYYKTARRSSGLWVARRTGSAWSTQLVDASALALYNQLAIDPTGNPAIAYSHDSNSDGAVDTLKFAHWNGSAWNILVVDGGGLYGTLAYDPTTGNPAVAHWNATTGQLRFTRWNGTAWSSAEIIETAPSITGCSLQFGPDGKAYLAYGSESMCLAIRDPGSEAWTVQVVEASSTGSLRNSLKGRPGMTPTGVAYRGPAEAGYASTVRLAFRKTPY